MTEKNGCCIYCGQIALVQVDVMATEDAVNRAATLVCNCDDARRYQDLCASAMVAKSNIEKMFPEDAWSEQEELMEKAVDLIAAGKIDSITITYKKVKAKISITSKSSIKVEKIRTLKEVTES